MTVNTAFDKANQQLLPDGFIYLEQLDPTIIQEMRYYGNHNFIGRPIEGYEADKCITTLKVAEALKRVQAELRGQSLTLKVYDAYRPLRAVGHFVEWANDVNDLKMKKEFYPDVDKSKLFELGYIGIRSQHTRGCAVDLTIVPIPTPKQDTYQSGDILVDGRLPKGTRFNDNSIEMGTGFDVFDELSHTANSNISDTAKSNRAMLVEIMAKHGFANYSKEWWHFYIEDEPFAETYFDFPIR